MTEFDIRNVLIGRELPEGEVSIWADDHLLFERESLENELAGATAKADVKKLEEAIAANAKALEESKLIVTIRGITPRASEDIISKALSELPIKRDVYSREDEHQMILRNRLIQKLSFAAHIVKIESPDGGVQVIDDENRYSVAEAILKDGTSTAISTIDAAIGTVSRNFAEKLAEWQSPDFS